MRPDPSARLAPWPLERCVALLTAQATHGRNLRLDVVRKSPPAPHRHPVFAAEAARGELVRSRNNRYWYVWPAEPRQAAA